MDFFSKAFKKSIIFFSLLFSVACFAYDEEQGFAVDAGSEVKITIDNEVLTGNQVFSKFAKKRVDEYD